MEPCGFARNQAQQEGPYGIRTRRPASRHHTNSACPSRCSNRARTEIRWWPRRTQRRPRRAYADRYTLHAYQRGHPVSAVRAHPVYGDAPPRQRVYVAHPVRLAFLGCHGCSYATPPRPDVGANRTMRCSVPRSTLRLRESSRESDATPLANNCQLALQRNDRATAGKAAAATPTASWAGKRCRR
jgi:hypothetical protein